MKIPEKDDAIFAIIVLVAVSVFSYFILGVSGMLSSIGIILLFIFPVYFILNNFNLKQDEKIVLSFFIGVGILPAFAYWIGLFISFRLSILLSFIILIIAGIVIKYIAKKKHD